MKGILWNRAARQLRASKNGTAEQSKVSIDTTPSRPSRVQPEVISIRPRQEHRIGIRTAVRPQHRSPDTYMTSRTGASQPPTDLIRDQILRRYASIDATRGWRQGLARLKQLAWIATLIWSENFKRSIDIVGALFLLTVLFPLLLIFGLLVKLTSPGPIFFTQTRVGKSGRLFKMYKFRSMRQGAQDRLCELLSNNQVVGGVTFKIKNDPRRTPVGSFMRTWSIDELPQLWNVLLGDMSLVGPRPPLPSEVQQYTVAQRRRLDAIPGLTCTWQVSGRSEIPFSKQVELDVEYIESQSLSLDVKLLFRTVGAVLQRRGAY